MRQLWITLADNVVYLMILLPLLGACLVHVVSPFGSGAIRRSVLINLLLSCVLAVIVVVHYSPQGQQDGDVGRFDTYQMVSDLRWVAGVQSKANSDQQKDGQHAVRTQVEDEHQDTATVSAEAEFLGPDIRITVGVDGISLWFIVLTVLMTYGVIVSNPPALIDRPAAYYSLLLTLEASLVGVFAALDVVLFCVFLELSALPMFFLIGGWGSYQRRSAAKKFVIYHLVGSLLVLAGVVSAVLAFGWMRASASNPSPQLTFSIPHLLQELPDLVAANRDAADSWRQFSPWVFRCLLFGFLLKAAIVPFHRWFIESHEAASWPVSAVLSAVVVKVGGYGIVRFVLPLFPEFCVLSYQFLSGLVLIGVIYTAFLAVKQGELKMLLTFAWVSHLGLCLLGILSLNKTGVMGGVLHLVNHGLSSGALLLLIGSFKIQAGPSNQSRWPTFREAPITNSFLFVTVFSLIGVPGLNGFVGETMILCGVFRENPSHAAWSLFGLLLLSWALIGITKDSFGTRTFRSDSSGHRPLPSIGNRDLESRQLISLAPLIALILAIGMYPQYFIDRIEPSVSRTLIGYPVASGGASDRRFRYTRKSVLEAAMSSDRMADSQRSLTTPTRDSR